MAKKSKDTRDVRDEVPKGYIKFAEAQQLLIETCPDIPPSRLFKAMGGNAKDDIEPLPGFEPIYVGRTRYILAKSIETKKGQKALRDMSGRKATGTKSKAAPTKPKDKKKAPSRKKAAEAPVEEATTPDADEPTEVAEVDEPVVEVDDKKAAVLEAKKKAKKKKKKKKKDKAKTGEAVVASRSRKAPAGPA